MHWAGVGLNITRGLVMCMSIKWEYVCRAVSLTLKSGCKRKSYRFVKRKRAACDNRSMRKAPEVFNKSREESEVVVVRAGEKG